MSLLYYIDEKSLHGLDTPKECYASMMLNYRWFLHYLLGENLKLSK